MNSLVLLAGCGLGDGSCIEEVILTYLALEKYKCSYQVAAMDMQAPSVNHISENTGEKRNVLVESARIGRSKIKDLSEVNITEFDNLIIPGGIGLLTNYSNQKSIQSLILSFHEMGKPVATMCAGIDFLRNILGDEVLQEAYDTVAPDDFCRDKNRNVFYTPAFRKTQDMCQVQLGIDRMIKELNDRSKKMEPCLIRCAKPEDYENVESIMKQVQQLHINWRPDIYKAADSVYSREYFRKLVDENRLLVAERDGTVVGLLSFMYRHVESDKQVTRDVLFVDDLAVDENHRGQGIGTELLQYVKNKVKKEHLDGLELQVNARNIAARKMYETFGFAEKSINLELL